MDSRGRTKLDMLPYGSREECKGLTGSLPGVGAGTRDKDGGDSARASAPSVSVIPSDFGSRSCTHGFVSVER